MCYSLRAASWWKNLLLMIKMFPFTREAFKHCFRFAKSVSWSENCGLESEFYCFLRAALIEE